MQDKSKNKQRLLILFSFLCCKVFILKCRYDY